MTDWDTFLQSCAKSIWNGLKKHDSYFESYEVGVLKNFGELDFPAIHMIPDTTNYTGNGQYEESVSVFFYFEKSRNEEVYWEYQTKVGEVIESVQGELKKNKLVNNYKPVNFNNYPGFAENTLLHVVEIEWNIGKLKGF